MDALKETTLQETQISLGDLAELTPVKLLGKSIANIAGAIDDAAKANNPALVKQLAGNADELLKGIVKLVE